MPEQLAVPVRGGDLAVLHWPADTPGAAPKVYDEVVIAGSDGTPRLYKLHREVKREIGDDSNKVKEFEKMGVAEKQWKCPSLVRLQGSPDPGLGEQSKKTKPKKQIHYLPTQFDSHPITPRRWPTQPWLMEIGNLHGQGPLMVFPDGAVISLNEFQRQGR